MSILTWPAGRRAGRRHGLISARNCSGSARRPLRSGRRWGWGNGSAGPACCVSATLPRKLRRDWAACSLSVSKMVDQPGSRHCSAWCIMSPVTTACWPLRADVDAAVMRRVAGRGGERERVVELVGVVDQQCLAGLDDRAAIVGPHVARRVGALLRHGLPVRVFALVENVLGLRERRHPAAVAQHACSSRCGRCAGACRTRA